MLRYYFKAKNKKDRKENSIKVNFLSLIDNEIGKY